MFVFYYAKMPVPKSHPRYLSLITRDKIVEGVKAGITSEHGLIAHGRGEAFDYLLGEKTNDFAEDSIDAACALLLTAKHPVISVNGNVAALVPDEIVKLSKAIPAKLEVNIFHESSAREKKIKEHLTKHGADEVLLPIHDEKFAIKYLEHNRRFVNPDGIFKADVVFVPLEDGDRCEALIRSGKKVITVDLNPMSRTAKNATITILDNIVRAVPYLISTIIRFKKTKSQKHLRAILKQYHNKKMLAKSIQSINTSKSPSNPSL